MKLTQNKENFELSRINLNYYYFKKIHVAPHFKHKYIRIKLSKVFNFNQKTV